MTIYDGYNQPDYGLYGAREIADYQDIASTEVAVGSPISVELLNKIQNNAVAYATRDNSVFNNSIVYTAGNTVFAVMSIEKSTGTTTRKLRLRAGTFRMKFRTYVASSTWTGQVGFKKNGKIDIELSEETLEFIITICETAGILSETEIKEQEENPTEG